MGEWIQHAIETLKWGRPGDLWVVVAAPVAVRLLLQWAAKWIEKMEPAGVARLRLSWLAAAMPGIAFLAFAPQMVHTLVPSPMTSITCRVHCYLLMFLLGLVVASAAWSTWRKSLAGAQLLKVARNPSPRLARFANELGIAAVELPTDTPVCAMAGILKPRVLVSRGALLRLSDEELRAALAHERAHLRRRETLREGIAAFLNKCTLIPVPATLGLYRRSREFVADREAARQVQPVTLANVLLAFAKFEVAQPAVQLAERANLRDRVMLLLNDAAPGALEKSARAVAIALISLTVVVTMIPLGVHEVLRMMCMKHG